MQCAHKINLSKLTHYDKKEKASKHTHRISSLAMVDTDKVQASCTNKPMKVLGCGHQ